ncbi:MAG: transposase [Terriglobales bacterium]
MKRYEGSHKTMRYVRSMRGNDDQQGTVFSYINPEERIPADHPLRRIRAILAGALKDLSTHFEALYARRGRPSIPPEKLLRALLLQILYAIRSARQLMEQLNYNLLFPVCGFESGRCGVGHDGVYEKPGASDAQGKIEQRLLEAVLEQVRAHDLLSEEHFTVGGTLQETWASRRSLVPKDSPPVGTGMGGKKLLPTRLRPSRFSMITGPG